MLNEKMNVFAPSPPSWTENAVHAVPFCCPNCKAPSTEATKVWLNRRAPVTDPNLKRRWQEFYLCKCNTTWWGWSNDRAAPTL